MIERHPNAETDMGGSIDARWHGTLGSKGTRGSVYSTCPAGLR